MRICRKCKKAKDISEFNKCKQYKDGVNTLCKKCHSLYMKSYKDKYYSISTNRKKRNLVDNKSRKLRKLLNPVEFKNKRKLEDRKYYLSNKENINIRNNEYNKKNRDIINKFVRKWQKEQLVNNIQFKLARRLRSRIRAALKNNKKQGSAVKDLGCSLKYLKIYLEKKFKPGMTWDNHGDWHIDHIRPLAKFDLSNRKEFLEAIHYTNLQPLWAEENMSKGGY